MVMTSTKVVPLCLDQMCGVDRAAGIPGVLGWVALDASERSTPHIWWSDL